MSCNGNYSKSKIAKERLAFSRKVIYQSDNVHTIIFYCIILFSVELNFSDTSHTGKERRRKEN